ncbi:MAG: hypothetical protein LBC73_02650 [Oscillospiraceae bacterium]|jgi:hypothetical protein|nr:hypothetical protein [Oscillospiraceae bacterium]
MSKYRILKNTIKEYTPDYADVPILYSTIEYNSKSFEALLGRKLKSGPIPIVFFIVTISIVLISIILTALFGRVGISGFIALFPVFSIIFFMRTTLIAVGDESMYIYIIEPKRDSTYTIYDKMSLMYDKITNVKVKKGKFNTILILCFLINNKKCKLRITIPNKDKKLLEQSVNLKYLLEKLASKVN